ncbi:hypothetical protein [Paenibacillus lentus]|uniref:Uncharacterized protein n=1 Tax=Paenibacillus lentus TaxID=1338368 RepID=A0A3Q8S4Y8_9BACL|nr:hypothetical protein [Paenibacillus lentus]AZK46783.1 hypothetical protein EIM92_11995 [Paenibacillus lentus]
MTSSSCKGCKEEYKVTEEQIKRILASSAFAPEKCVPDEVYARRLELCSTCPKFQDGVTCLVCGCIIPVVAKLKERECALPGQSRWGAYREGTFDS